MQNVSKTVDPNEIDIHLSCLPLRYMQITSEHLIALHIQAVHQFLKLQQRENANLLKPILLWNPRPERGHSELICVTWDRQNLFSRIAEHFPLPN
ncbi:MAG: hypothetical protein R3F23_03135 [Verrucomicrobiia bacterium]